jgi:hypothetical protein
MVLNDQNKALKRPISLFSLILSTTIAFSNTAFAAYERCTPAAVLAPASIADRAPANNLGCNEGLSIKLPNGDAVWRCARPWDGTKSASGNLMLIAADGTIRALPDTTTRAGFGQFSIWQIDLDGDGEQEQILSTWNGRGAPPARPNSWTSIVFRANWQPLDGDTGTASRSMAGASDIHDWGLGNLIRDPINAGNCLIALSEFKNRGSEFGLQVDFHELGTASLRKAITPHSVFRPWSSTLRSQRSKTLRRARYTGDVATWIASADTVALPPN